MAEFFIRPRNHTGSSNDDFVGMVLRSTDASNTFVDAIFPYGYKHSTNEKQAELKKELFLLLNTIKRYSKSVEQELYGLRGVSEGFPFDAYITIIKAFMQNGYYIESEIKYKNAQIGKINWKRTISSVKPLLQNNSPIYTDYIIRQNEKKTDNMISLIHEWCVFEAFQKLGWIFTTFNPHKPRLQIKHEDRSYFISIIHDSQKTTFNDRNKLLFNAMIAMLSFERANDKNSFFFGTTHFHTVWENFVDITYGITDEKKRKYFPKATWHFVNGESKGNLLLPDTIMKTDESEIFVLDAKYYSLASNFNVPAAADINKQITYGNFAAQNDTIVYNAFIMPYNFEDNPCRLDTSRAPYGYIGYAVLEHLTDNKTHEKVLGILVDTRWLMEITENKNKDELAKFIKEKHSWKELN
ncbi:MAG: LlaJI family restriction endonuclease [Christensenellaceae bacterium]|jgi:hypothetical protein|nr:LlaJI family restriction endonuclease [Christensenellaceae bacterium]